MKTGWCIKILRYWVKFSVYNVWDCECVAIIYKLFFFILSLCCILLVFSFFYYYFSKKKRNIYKIITKTNLRVLVLYYYKYNALMVKYFPPNSFWDSACCPSRFLSWFFLWVGWTYILLIFPLFIPYFPFFQIAPWRIMPQEVCPNQSWYNAWLSWWYYIRGYLYMNLKFI